ncbi:MAG: NAD(P)/FAD-dependent oxidoreductase [Gemmatimonadota bacterium]
MRGAGRVRDVVVVGAGPAGSLLARACAQEGLDVLLVDRIRRPAHKVCGCCVNAAGRAVLERAGLASILEQAGCASLHTLDLHVDGRRTQVPLAGGVAWSRRAMDAALLRAARSAGVEVAEGVRARLVPPSGASERPGPWREVALEASGATRRVRARVVVDAAGLAGLAGDTTSGSPVVQPGSLMGAGAILPAHRVHVEVGSVRMAAARGGYVGLVRLEDGTVNVAAALEPGFLRRVGDPGSAVAGILAASGAPPLPCEARGSGEPLWGWKGTPPLTRRARRVAGPRLFRVGDAAGYVEPFTGEGMAWALAGAQALAPLVTVAARSARWPAEVERAWQACWDAGWRRGSRLCRAAAWTLRRPPVARAAVRLASVAPGVAARVAAGARSAPWVGGEW